MDGREVKGTGEWTTIGENGANLTGNFNGANQVTALTRSGSTRVAGFTDEPAAVTVNGTAARQWPPPGGTQFAFEADFTQPDRSYLSFIINSACAYFLQRYLG